MRRLVSISEDGNFLGLQLAASLGAFERKRALPKVHLFALAVAAIAYNCSSQLNLSVNTVSSRVLDAISFVALSNSYSFVESER